MTRIEFMQNESSSPMLCEILPTKVRTMFLAERIVVSMLSQDGHRRLPDVPSLSLIVRRLFIGRGVIRSGVTPGMHGVSSLGVRQFIGRAI